MPSAEQNRPVSSLPETEAEFHRIAVKEAEHFGLAAFDLAGRVTYWNAGAARIFGYSEEEALGLTFEALFRPEDTQLCVPQKELREALEKGHTENERWHPHKSGQLFWASGVTSTLRNGTGESVGFTKCFREGTLRKRTDDEIKAANSRLLQFAYIASHDLDEPLRMVTCFLTLLREKVRGKLDSECEEYLSFAVDGGRRMRKLLASVLESSKIGIDPKLLQETDLNTVVDGAVSFMLPRIREAGAIVTRANLPCLMVVTTQIEQLFQNLFSNAIKFRAERAPRVFVDAVEQGDEWLFTVRDNGRGIPEGDRDRIFETFERGITSDDYPGTGLGLAICKRIVLAHAGRIWVESRVGEGSTFYFTLSKRLARLRVPRMR